MLLHSNIPQLRIYRYNQITWLKGTVEINSFPHRHMKLKVWNFGSCIQFSIRVRKWLCFQILFLVQVRALSFLIELSWTNNFLSRKALTRFGQNQARTIREDDEFSLHNTSYNFINFDPKMFNLFINQFLSLLHLW